jgi:hypothetical protein
MDQFQSEVYRDNFFSFEHLQIHIQLVHIDLQILFLRIGFICLMNSFGDLESMKT